MAGFLRADTRDRSRCYRESRPGREGPLVAAAFKIAHATSRTVYDSLHVALAVHVGAVMVTADDRLVNALVGTAWAGNILRLVDVP